MPVTLGCIELDPPVFLAPMAGITDLPFRTIAERFGAGLVVSEMVASAEMLHGRPEARARAALGLGRARTAVQLAGREPAPMAAAARLLEGEGAPIIDINMGCPAKKVTGGWSGAALMREPDRPAR
jgi:tRNA-dihydrouridine synthase B